MSAIQRINTRRLISKLQQDVSNVLSSGNVFFGGQNMTAEAIKLAISQELLRLQHQNFVNQWTVDVGADKDGKVLCTIKYQVPQQMNHINVVFSVDRMLNGFFYAILIGGKWCLCTEKDIYKPDYSPMVIMIGDSTEDWELYTQEAALKKGVHLDEIMTWVENYELPAKESPWDMKSCSSG